MRAAASTPERPRKSVRKGPGSTTVTWITEGFELGGKRLREAFYGELGGVVEAPPGRANESADRGEIDDMTGAALAEVREKGAGDADEAEDVGLEDGHELIFGSFLDGAGEAIAGVVDEDVDRAEAGSSLSHDGEHLRGVSDVKRVGLGAVGVLLLKVGHLSPHQGAGGGDDLAAVRRISSASRRPKPVEAPVMNQTLGALEFGMVLERCVRGTVRLP